MKKQPEITAKTRKKLMDAFWDIYCEKGIHQTTVGAVTKTACFNRGTFYEYFTDIYDLLDQLENDLLDSLKEQTEKRFKDKLPESFQEYSRTCAEIFSLYEDKLYILLSAQGDPSFAAKLQKKMQPLMFSIMGFSDEQPHLDYLITFGFSTLISMLGHWYETGKEMALEDLFQIMQSLVATGVLGYTKKEIFHDLSNNF